MAEVFLHVGLPKTGTTSIQAGLDQHVTDLAAHGVLLPGGRQHAHRLATYDLLGQRIEGDTDDRVAGSLGRLIEEINRYDGRAVVISDEDLGLARPRQARRLVRALAGHQVYVVLGIRDLGRTLVSAWQQTVAMGGTTTWAEFVAEIRSPGSGVPSAGAGFAARHDALRVLDTWSAAVPADRVRLVTVPPAGSPPSLLLERFCSAVGLPTQLLAGAEVRNESLGSAELEVLRRLNAHLGGALPKRQYRHVIETGLRPSWSSPQSRRPVLPASDHPWVLARSEALVAALVARGHPVCGDLADLLPAPTSADRPLDDVSQDELLAAAETALTALALAHGRLFGRFRRMFFVRQGRPPTLSEALGSGVRASSFRLQKHALAAADRNRALAWVARRYARRRPGGGAENPGSRTGHSS